MRPAAPELPAASSEAPIHGGARRRAAFSRSDLVSLLLGGTLVLAMLGWFSWRMAQNLLRDRGVDVRVEAPAHGH